MNLLFVSCPNSYPFEVCMCFLIALIVMMLLVGIGLHSCHKARRRMENSRL